MMFSFKKAVVSALVLSMGFAAQAFGATSSVTLVNVAGSRALTIKSMTGDNLTAVSLGSARESPFLVNVSDLAYDRKNYQVTANISNLYSFNVATSAFDCAATHVPSSAISIGFLANPNSIRGVAAAAQPVLSYVGTVSGAVATALGLSSPTQVTSQVTEQLQDFATSTVFSGAEAVLPLKLAAAAGGTFSAPAPQANCNASATGATSVELQRGNISQDQAMLDWVSSTAHAAYDLAAGSDAALSIAEGVSGGMITQGDADTAVRNALTALGISPLAITDTLLGQVETTMAAAAPAVASILRQTGSYTSLPKIVIGDLTGIPTGTYRGTMTITLIEP